MSFVNPDYGHEGRGSDGAEDDEDEPRTTTPAREPDWLAGAGMLLIPAAGLAAVGAGIAGMGYCASKIRECIYNHFEPGTTRNVLEVGSDLSLFFGPLILIVGGVKLYTHIREKRRRNNESELEMKI